MGEWTSIHGMNLSALDLNLLVVLEALLEERHVTRAGRRVGLSQPATSNALSRLREMLGDELLVRVGRELQLTPRAEQLRAAVGEALSALRRALEAPQPFEPASCQEVFRLGMSDYAAWLLLPGLRRRLAEVAPVTTLLVLPLEARAAAAKLAHREIDLGIDVLGELATELPRRELLLDSFVCVLSRQHPLARRRLTLESFIAWPHLLISPGGQRQGAVDRQLEQLGLQRRVVMTVPHFLMAPHLVAGSDLLCVLPGRVARRLAEPLGLLLRPPPLPLPGFNLSMVWHPRLERAAAQAWLRQLVVQVASEEADAGHRMGVSTK